MKVRSEFYPPFPENVVATELLRHGSPTGLSQPYLESNAPCRIQSRLEAPVRFGLGGNCSSPGRVAWLGKGRTIGEEHVAFSRRGGKLGSQNSPEKFITCFSPWTSGLCRGTFMRVSSWAPVILVKWSMVKKAGWILVGLLTGMCML